MKGKVKGKGKGGGKGKGKGKRKGKGHGKGGGKAKGKGKGKGRSNGESSDMGRELKQLVGEVLTGAGENVYEYRPGGKAANRRTKYPVVSRRTARREKRQVRKEQKQHYYERKKKDVSNDKLKGSARKKARKAEQEAQENEEDGDHEGTWNRGQGRRRRDYDEEITSEEEDGGGDIGLASKRQAPAKEDTGESTDDGDEDVEGEEEEIQPGDEEEEELEDEEGGLAQTEEPSQDFGSGGYVPPHLRKVAADAKTATAGMEAKRLMRGLVNRVTEGNLDQSGRELVKVVGQLCADIGAASAAEVFASIVLPAAVGDPNCAVLVQGCHAALTGVAHVLFGQAFGGTILLQSGDRLESNLKASEEAQEAMGEHAKLARNNVIFISLLFSFGVLPGSLIFDLMRFVLKDARLTELRADLALTLLRYAGRKLRSECAADFKAVLSFVTEAAATTKSAKDTEGGDSNSRIDFLLRELNDLKNNKVSFAVMDRFEQTYNWLKQAPVLNKKKISDHQLGIPFKWLAEPPPPGWPVGSKAGAAVVTTPAFASMTQGQSQDPLRAAAIAQRLSTELRQTLFVALMGAEDFEHATDRLAEVAVAAKSGTEEACLVLFHCAVREQTPNPFYEHVAIQLCGRPAPWGKKFAHNMKRATVQHLQQAHTYGLRAIVNLAELCAAVIASAEASVPLAVVRFLKFGAGGGKELGGVLGILLRHLLESLVQRLADTQATLEVFQGLKKYEDVREGLLLVMDTLVKPRLLGKAKAPAMWEKFRVARRELAASRGDKAG